MFKKAFIFIYQSELRVFALIFYSKLHQNHTKQVPAAAYWNTPIIIRYSTIKTLNY